MNLLVAHFPTHFSHNHKLYCLSPVLFVGHSLILLSHNHKMLSFSNFTCRSFAYTLFSEPQTYVFLRFYLPVIHSIFFLPTTNFVFLQFYLSLIDLLPFLTITSVFLRFGLSVVQLPFSQSHIFLYIAGKNIFGVYFLEPYHLKPRLKLQYFLVLSTSPHYIGSWLLACHKF